MFEKIRVVPPTLAISALLISAFFSMILFFWLIFIPNFYVATTVVKLLVLFLIFVVITFVHLYLIGRGVIQKKEQYEMDFPTVADFRVRFPARYNLFSKRYVDTFKRYCPFCGELIRVDSQWREHSFDTQTGEANSYFLEVTCGKDHLRHKLVATKGEKEAMA